jgi:Xaa-Pro aminopeptidase
MDYTKHYVSRVKKLIEQLPNQSVYILKAAEPKIRSNDTEYGYRQNSDFYYLTGLEETDLYFVIKKTNTKSESVLFCKESDISEIQWVGPRLGVEGMKATQQFTDVFSIELLNSKILELFHGAQQIYFDFSEAPSWHQMIMGWLNTLKAKNRKGVTSPDSLRDARKILHEMRLIKQPEEIALLQKAADISCLAHRRAMQKTKPGMMEYALEAEYIHEFYAQGARSPAYTSIVGGGENACILHYVNNNKMLANNDLVLVDAACEYQYYCADITRTFPVNGKFSGPQQAIYELVLAAQESAIQIIKPGIAFGAIQEKVLDIMVQGLLDLKILKGEKQNIIKNQLYQPFYMHNSGHWLGIDVHDCGEYKVDNVSRQLVPGMVLTVEPGLYFSSLLLKNTSLDSKWLGIGIRIEDDILVTENGHKNLTEAAPKAISDIQRIMSQ